MSGLTDVAEPGERNLRAALKSRAIRFLSRREHSRIELRRKLLAVEVGEAAAAIVDEVLDELQAERWQSDQRFAEVFIRSRAGRLGSARLVHELSARGIARPTADPLVEPLRGEAEIERAHALWWRRFGAVPADRKEMARQGRFLMQRGFSEATVRRVFDRARKGDGEASLEAGAGPSDT